jgi:hypothetical protein
MPIPYKSIPKVAVFKRDCQQAKDPGPRDPILKYVWEVLGEYESNHSRFMWQAAKMREIVILGRLYYATDLWLKDSKPSSSAEDWKLPCKPIVADFYRVVCTTLADKVGVGINALPTWLTETYGKGLTDHAVSLDLDKKLAKYMDQAEVDLCRIKFRNGRAYMRELNTGRIEWVAASSDAYKNDRIFAGGGAKHQIGHAGYVLSLGGDFFMGNHRVGGKQGEQANVYHSSYRSGEAIRCAGTWKVDNGFVKEISTSSGHYQPDVRHLLIAVETLKAYGVNLDKLVVHYYLKGQQFYGEPALTFMQKHRTGTLAGNREGYIKGQNVEQPARRRAFG